MMRSLKHTKGYLLINAIVLMVIAGFVAGTAAVIFTTSGRSTADQVMTTQAFYIAKAGLQRGMNAVASLDTGSRVDCEAINGLVDYTNMDLGAGEFSVTTTEYNPANVALSTNIDASQTIIPVTSVTGFASNGSIFVGGEAVDYGAIGTTAGECSPYSAPCFLGGKRGSGGTSAIGHILGDPVAQNMCFVQSTGWVPSESNPLASRTLSEGVVFETGTSNVWSVGDNQAGEVILNWNGTDWTREPLSGAVPNKNLYAIHMIAADDAWVVGDTQAGCTGTSIFLHYDGNNWTRICSTDSGLNKDMLAVHCIDSNNCWAAGKSGKIAIYDGNWNEDTVDRSGGDKVPTNKSLRGIHMTSLTTGWVVGDSSSGELIVEYAGGEWKRFAKQGSIPNEHLYGVHCPVSDECWAVGDDGTIAHYTGGTWTGSGFTVNANVAGLDLRGVYCISTSLCWGVGMKSSGAVFIKWNGTEWSRDTASLDVSVVEDDMLDIHCLDEVTCWAAGKGHANVWNGTTWFDASTGIVDNGHDINAIGGLPGSGGSSGSGTARIFEWKENFN